MGFYTRIFTNYQYVTCVKFLTHKILWLPINTSSSLWPSDQTTFEQPKHRSSTTRQHHPRLYLSLASLESGIHR
jgi:hypothetical protein